ETTARAKLCRMKTAPTMPVGGEMLKLSNIRLTQLTIAVVVEELSTDGRVVQRLLQFHADKQLTILAQTLLTDFIVTIADIQERGLMPASATRTDLLTRVMLQAEITAVTPAVETVFRAVPITMIHLRLHQSLRNEV